jgi:hypothetical protein
MSLSNELKINNFFILFFLMYFTISEFATISSPFNDRLKYEYLFESGNKIIENSKLILIKSDNKIFSNKFNKFGGELLNIPFIEILYTLSKYSLVEEMFVP